jgi:hypothetical protein
MGSRTRQALTEFQKGRNLEATGRLDEPTRSALGIAPEGATSGVGGAESGQKGHSGVPGVPGTRRPAE